MINNVYDFKRFAAARRRKFGDVSRFFADEGFGERGRQRNQVLFNVGFIIADNLIFFLFFGIFVNNDNGCAKADNVAFGLSRINYLSAADNGFKLLNASFDEAMLFLGGGVFRILGQITVGTGLGNCGDNVGAFNAF